MPVTFHTPATPPHILTLVAATATGAVAMNVFLPSLPGMASYFQADYAIVQLTVSLYLAATALLQLGLGPASDRFGRRPVMLVAFAIFIASTFAAIHAPNIWVLLFCRVMQAFAAAGMVLSRAIVRDTVDPNETASRLGYVTMGMTLAPMLGPMVGGFLDEIYGWQSTFYLTLGFGIVSFVVVYIDLGETNMNRSSSFGAQFRNYPELLRSRRFWGYTTACALASGGFFAFVGGGPYVATRMLNLSPSQYGMYFILISFGYMLGNLLSARLSKRVGITRMMLAGNVVGAIGMMISLLLFSAGYHYPLSLFGPSFFMGMGNGMTIPNANAGIVSVRPHLAGSASGLGGAMQIGGGAVLSVSAGILLTPQSGPYPLLWIMFVTSVLAVVATLYVMYVARKASDI